MSRPGQRTPAELGRLQREAVERWEQARRSAEEAAQAPTASREVRMDLVRRREVLREQHLGVQERLAAGPGDATGPLRRRAVVLHRNAWFCGKLCDALEQQGVPVVALLENGARGVGVVVAEQPDLLVVEDVLPMLPGDEVVRETRRWSPQTLVVAQVAHEERIPHMLDAGARAAYTRRVPPGDVVREVLGLMGDSDLVGA